MVEAFGACYWCAHGAKSAAESAAQSAAAMFLGGQWACVGKALLRHIDGDGDQKANTTDSGRTSDDAHGKIQAAKLKNKRHFLIVCDGNIGCGKTTFLDEIGKSQQHLPSDVKIFREPVAENAPHSWRPLLQKFYAEMKNGNGSAAVIELENTIWAHHREIATQREPHVITERCCDSSVWVFCKALQDKGILPESPLVLTMRPETPFFVYSVHDVYSLILFCSCLYLGVLPN